MSDISARTLGEDADYGAGYRLRNEAGVENAER
jgi:hypothetical protein